jgi:hypothetical protein
VSPAAGTQSPNKSELSEMANENQHIRAKSGGGGDDGGRIIIFN